MIDHLIIFKNDFLFIKFKAMVRINIELLTFSTLFSFLIMQTPLAPQQSVYCVNDETYCYKIIRGIITDM